MSDTTPICYNGLNLDKELVDATDRNVNQMIPWYIISAYAYYEEDDPILSDAAFDKLSKKMIEAWDTIEHYHKEYVTLDNLRYRTYTGEYPKRIKGGLDSLRDAYKIGMKYEK